MPDPARPGSGSDRTSGRRPRRIGSRSRFRDWLPCPRAICAISSARRLGLRDVGPVRHVHVDEELVALAERKHLLGQAGELRQRQHDQRRCTQPARSARSGERNRSAERIEALQPGRRRVFTARTRSAGRSTKRSAPEGCRAPRSRSRRVSTPPRPRARTHIRPMIPTAETAAETPRSW